MAGPITVGGEITTILRAQSNSFYDLESTKMPRAGRDRPNGIPTVSVINAPSVASNGC